MGYRQTRCFLIVLLLLECFPLTALGVDESKNDDAWQYYCRAMVQVKQERIKRLNGWVDWQFANAITKKIDAHITPQTNWGVKFVYGVLEGIPKGVKDLAQYGYIILENTAPKNLQFSIR